VFNVHFTSFIRANNSHVGTIKYLINNYSLFILINIRNVIYCTCLMLGNYFRRSTDHKKRVNEKQQVEIDSPASSGG
jgi:hypothetical protein